MEGDCVVFGCRNSSVPFPASRSKCDFFKFPIHKQDLLDQWLEKLYLQGWTPGPENVLCEEHFSLDSFEFRDNRKILKLNAVPNLVEEWDRVILNNAHTWYEESNENHDENIGGSRDLRCRICTAHLSSKNAVYIFSEDGNVIDKMKACIPISVKTDDTLPKHICRVCLLDLNTSYRMLVRALESEKFFNSFMQELEEKFKLHDIMETNPEDLMTIDLVPRAVCEACDLSFEDFQHLSKHLEQQHVDELIIDKQPTKKEANIVNAEPKKTICSQFRNIVDNINEETGSNSHIVDAEVTQEYKCRMCDTVFYSINHLEEHILSHVNPLICKICGFTCYDQENMLKHEENHVKLGCENYVCPSCSIIFSANIELEHHLRKVHSAKNTKTDAVQQKWICKYCGKEIGTKLNLMVHERVHTGARPFCCEFCGCRFKCRAHLIQHQPIHTGIKRHKCSICNKAFARKAFVNTHMRVHTGERPFKCDICGKRYTQIGDMRRHKRKHVTETNDFEDLLESALQPKNDSVTFDMESTIRDNMIPINNFKDDKLMPVLECLNGKKLIRGTGVMSHEKSNSFQQTIKNEEVTLMPLDFTDKLTEFRRILMELQ